MLRKELEKEAEKNGVKLVEKKSQPRLATDNVVKLEPKHDQPNPS
jgi:hypothetical protein